VDFKSVCWSEGISHSFFADAASKGGASPREMDFNVAGAMFLLTNETTTTTCQCRWCQIVRSQAAGSKSRVERKSEDVPLHCATRRVGTKRPNESMATTTTTNDGVGAPVAKKRRKSRWESAPEPSDAVEGEAGGSRELAVSGLSAEVPAAEAKPTTALVSAPVNTLVIGAGIFVQLPTSVLTEYNAPSSASPEVHFLFRELAEMNRRLIAGE
jgi:hypothetical protein